MPCLRGKVALITGAGSGIGEGIALEFATQGAKVVLNGRNVDKLKKAAERITQTGIGQEKILIVPGDVSKEADAEMMVQKTVDHFGKLDCLVNNAGIAKQDRTLSDYDNVINTNVRAPYYLSTLAIPHLIKTKGNIINISSVAAFITSPGMTSYCMSKGAVHQLTRNFALKLAPHQVRVNSLNPGIIKTDIFSATGIPDEAIQQMMEASKKTHPIGRVGEPKDVAKAAVFLASDDASFITGASLPIDGGFLINNLDPVVQSEAFV